MSTELCIYGNRVVILYCSVVTEIGTVELGEREEGRGPGMCHSVNTEQCTVSFVCWKIILSLQIMVNFRFIGLFGSNRDDGEMNGKGVHRMFKDITCHLG